MITKAKLFERLEGIQELIAGRRPDDDHQHARLLQNAFGRCGQPAHSAAPGGAQSRGRSMSLHDSIDALLAQIEELQLNALDAAVPAMPEEDEE